MNKFPDNFNLENSNNFSDILKHEITCKLRKLIYRHLLHNDKDLAFDLSEFNSKYVEDMDVTIELVNVIISELIERGWKCAFAYGSTWLYIYPPNDIPTSCGENFV